MRRRVPATEPVVRSYRSTQAGIVIVRGGPSFLCPRLIGRWLRYESGRAAVGLGRTVAGGGRGAGGGLRGVAGAYREFRPQGQEHLFDAAVVSAEVARDLQEHVAVDGAPDLRRRAYRVLVAGAAGLDDAGHRADEVGEGRLALREVAGDGARDPARDAAPGQVRGRPPGAGRGGHAE